MKILAQKNEIWQTKNQNFGKKENEICQKNAIGQKPQFVQ